MLSRVFCPHRKRRVPIVERNALFRLSRQSEWPGSVSATQVVHSRFIEFGCGRHGLTESAPAPQPRFASTSITRRCSGPIGLIANAWAPSVEVMNSGTSLGVKSVGMSNRSSAA